MIDHCERCLLCDELLDVSLGKVPIWFCPVDVNNNNYLDSHFYYCEYKNRVSQYEIQIGRLLISCVDGRSLTVISDVFEGKITEQKRFNHTFTTEEISKYVRLKAFT